MYREAVKECGKCSPSVSVMQIAVGASAQNQCQGKDDDNEKNHDLNKRRHVFEPSKDFIWESEYDQAGEEKDGDLEIRVLVNVHN
jgi:hypothetical protein